MVSDHMQAFVAAHVQDITLLLQQSIAQAMRVQPCRRSRHHPSAAAKHFIREEYDLVDVQDKLQVRDAAESTSSGFCIQFLPQLFPSLVPLSNDV